MSIAVLLVVLVAAVGFVAFCLYDLVRAPEVRYLPKPAWALIIVISIPLGGIIYLVAGRGRAARRASLVDTVGPPPSPGSRGEPSSRTTGAMPRHPHRNAGSIEVDRLSKHFGPIVAVDDLSFEVRPGHVTGFLGPNGAGKTTTMRVVLGLDAPTTGRTSVGGRSYQKIPRPLREVGSLLDADAAHPGRAALLHILSVAQSNGIGRQRVLEVLELTGIAQVAHRRVGEFSLGMKQRLGIAAALLGDPPILLFDEPANGLDPEGVRWVRELFKSLAAEGRTVFVSSHLMSEMALTADHLIIIGQGRLLADASTQDFVAANARKDVFVRSPDAGELINVLRDAGARAAPDEDGGLSVTGIEAPGIARLAAERGIAVYELTPRHASLEDAYLDLTRESVEYRAGPTGESSSGSRR
jgi:ABC-2 type transport system ATP-binding protein